ncbi:unnamed protein product [Cunninghamella blakesleeana]
MIKLYIVFSLCILPYILASPIQIMKSWNVCQSISSVEDHFDLKQGYKPFSKELKSFGYIHQLNIDCHKFKPDQKIDKSKSITKQLLSESLPNKSMMVLTKLIYKSPTEPIILEGYTSKKNFYPLKKKLKPSTKVEFSLSSYYYDTKEQEWFRQWFTKKNEMIHGKVKRIEKLNYDQGKDGQFGIRLILDPTDQLQKLHYKIDASSTTNNDVNTFIWSNQYDDSLMNSCFMKNGDSIKTNVLKKPEALMQLISSDVLF